MFQKFPPDHGIGLISQQYHPGTKKDKRVSWQGSAMSCHDLAKWPSQYFFFHYFLLFSPLLVSKDWTYKIVG